MKAFILGRDHDSLTRKTLTTDDVAVDTNNRNGMTAKNG